jgi:hypothetical protein
MKAVENPNRLIELRQFARFPASAEAQLKQLENEEITKFDFTNDHGETYTLHLIQERDYAYVSGAFTPNNETSDPTVLSHLNLALAMSDMAVVKDNRHKKILADRYGF